MPHPGPIQIINDANATTYALLADNGLIWLCEWNAQAERWDKVQPVPGADGGRELQVLVMEKLRSTGGVSGDQQGKDETFALVSRGPGRLRVVVVQKLLLVTELIRGYVKVLDELSLHLVDTASNMASLLTNRFTGLDRR